MKAVIVRMNKVIYYGWYMVLFSALTYFLSAPGQTYSISVFIKSYIEEFGYSQTTISTAYSVATIISGSMLVFMGKAVDKFGVKRMVIVVGFLLSVTTFYNSFVSSIYMIFVGFIFLRYFGQGSMTLIPATLVPQWFKERRAFAISLATIGGLLATLAVPSINLWMINLIGWQNAWRVWSVVLIVVFIPIAFLFTVNKPEDLNMTIENKDEVDNIEDTLKELERTSFTLKEAIKVKEFWIVGMISMIPAMVSTGLTFHFFTFMELRNVDSEAAAMIIGMLAIPAFFMPFVSKLVVDRYPVKNILSTTLSVTILSMLFLVFFVSNSTTAIVFILVYGLGIAIQALSTSVFWPNYFGRLHLGSIRGAATVFMVIGSALGPLPFGLSFDITGNYNVAIIGMIIFVGISFFLSFFIEKPQKSI